MPQMVHFIPPFWQTLGLLPKFENKIFLDYHCINPFLKYGSLRNKYLAYSLVTLEWVILSCSDHWAKFASTCPRERRKFGKTVFSWG